MTMPLYFLLALAVVVVAASVIADRRLTKQIGQLDIRLQEQKMQALKEMDAAIAEWLVMLELPQLEEETKRQAVAHQLSIVLIGKLLRSRVPCCSPNTK